MRFNQKYHDGVFYVYGYMGSSAARIKDYKLLLIKKSITIYKNLNQFNKNNSEHKSKNEQFRHIRTDEYKLNSDTCSGPVLAIFEVKCIFD